MEIKEEYTISKVHNDPERNSSIQYYLLKCDDTPEYVIGVEIFNGCVTDISLNRVFKFGSLDRNTYDVYEKISENLYVCSVLHDLHRPRITFIQIRTALERVELIELMYDSDADEVFLNGVRCITKE